MINQECIKVNFKIMRSGNWFYITLVLYLLKVAVHGYTRFKHLMPDTDVVTQENAVRNLILRTLNNDLVNNFSVSINTNLNDRTFQIRKCKEDNNIYIEGSDGVSLAKGFHHYMKYYLNVDVSWTNTKISLHSNVYLPDVNYISTSASIFIYYQNVCTWGYSFVWWNWSTWRQHIDWMAMMGVTLTIAPIQEYIWHDIYIEEGLTESEISEHFSGPGFQPWQRMGNIRGWGGPLPPAYLKNQLLLQKRIINSQRELGMTVAIPAFAGHLPKAFNRLYPNVTFTNVEKWNNFNDSFCCDLFLNPTENLFKEIASKFLIKAIEHFGSNHVYFADPFNEVQPHHADVSYLNMSAYRIYESMRFVDSNAIWLLQGWMFVKNTFWSDQLIKAFLTAVPIGHMIILDLQSEQFPQYVRTYSFYGQPFIWCMLHNFGGTLGLHGSAEIVNTRIGIARNTVNSSMIGVGITPEGIYQNYVMYALALERGWSLENFNLHEWFNIFANVRYGVENVMLKTSWQILKNSVYSYRGLKRMRGKYTIARRPSLNIDPWIWYNPSMILEAWMLLLAANRTIEVTHYENYEYDLVDLTRQFLQTMADNLYINLKIAYRKRNIDYLIYISQLILNIFDDLDSILRTNEHYLLGPWLESAKEMASNSEERVLYEKNARYQITLWGPNGEILDYANKQWSGLIFDYYKPRWNLFLVMLTESLQQNKHFNQTHYNKIVFEHIESVFCEQQNLYPTYTIGKSISISQQIFNKWTQLLYNENFKKFVSYHIRQLRN